MKTQILTILAATFGLAAFAQTEVIKVDDNTTVIVITNNNNSEAEKAEKEKKDKEEKEKKDKDEKDKKDKDQGNNGNTNNGTGSNGSGSNGGSGTGGGNGSGGNSPGPLGLEDLNTAVGISSYPNPASDQLFVSNIPGNAATYVLINTEGYESARGSVTGSQLNISVKSYPAGVYHIQLLDNSQAVLYKNRVIINN